MSLHRAVDRILEHHEPKYFAQFQIAALSLRQATTTPAPIDLFALPQGLGDDFVRTTDTISADYIVINWILRPLSHTFIPVRPTVRILIFQWHFNGFLSPPSVGSLLYTTTNGFKSILTRRIVDTQDTFTMLYDRVIYLGSHYSTDIATVPQFEYDADKDHGYIEIPKSRLRNIEFNSSATTGTDHIYMVAFSLNDDAIILDLTANMKYTMK